MPKEDRGNTAVSIVTFNNRASLASTIESDAIQRGFELGRNLFIKIADNCSTDGTSEALAEISTGIPGIELTLHPTNLGFCRAHNLALTQALNAGALHVLVLNPDLRLEPDALELLTAALESDGLNGLCCPKLYRADAALKPVSPPLLDAAGMFITPELRHFDRGSNAAPSPEFDTRCYVFGASGAALLLSRACIEDCNLSSRISSAFVELFDEAFFAYREDADLSWRALRLGWKCLYVPEAVGYHVRQVLPNNRSTLPPELNRYSVRNRFLLQLNNLTICVALRCLSGLVLRNFAVITAVLTIERSSLPALREVIKLARRALNHNSIVRKRARVRGFALCRWFSQTPFREPALSPAIVSKQVKNITAIIVNFNSGERLAACIDALLKTRTALPEHELTIVVVDNASTDQSALNAKNRFRDISGISIDLLPKNTGFAGGINAGAKRAPADAFLILNPDIEVNPAALHALTDALAQFPELAVTAPQLIGKTGTPQERYTFRRLPTFGTLLVELFLLHRLWPANPWSAHYYMQDEKAPLLIERRLPQLVEQPAGACLLIRASDFDELSGFDAGFYPAWFEDVDFMKRVQLRGRLAAVCNVEVVHEGGYSVKGLSPSEFRKLWLRNLKRYWQKHGSWGQYVILCAVIPVTETLRRIFSAYLRKI